MMDRDQNYCVHSLELHLFFARIMKEHSFFLKVGFLPPNANLAREGEHFLRQFESLLSRAIALSHCAVRGCVLGSGEVFTEFTDLAERQTQQFTGTRINRELTAREKQLRGFCGHEQPLLSPTRIRQVQQLNQEALKLVTRLIRYKEQLLCRVRSCGVFTVNYPLLIEHILREARLYRAQLIRLEKPGSCSDQELRDNEWFWNQIMMEHALFIRGLLDPSEEELTHAANDFAADYKRLLEAATAANDKTLRSGNPLGLTQKFRDFKRAGVQGIESCKIQSIILPLLADHVLREANHYLRVLEAGK